MDSVGNTDHEGEIARQVAADRGTRRLLDVLPELSEPIAGPPSEQILDELRADRV